MGGYFHETSHAKFHENKILAKISEFTVYMLCTYVVHKKVIFIGWMTKKHEELPSRQRVYN